MTNPTLERAARAAADVGAECGLQTNDGAASWEEIGVHYADIARAVLMAVRIPDEGMIKAAIDPSLECGGLFALWWVIDGERRCLIGSQ